MCHSNESGTHHPGRALTAPSGLPACGARCESHPADASATCLPATGNHSLTTTIWQRSVATSTHALRAPPPRTAGRVGAADGLRHGLHHGHLLHRRRVKSSQNCPTHSPHIAHTQSGAGPRPPSPYPQHTCRERGLASLQCGTLLQAHPDPHAHPASPPSRRRHPARHAARQQRGALAHRRRGAAPHALSVILILPVPLLLLPCHILC